MLLLPYSLILCPLLLYLHPVRQFIGDLFILFFGSVTVSTATTLVDVETINEKNGVKLEILDKDNEKDVADLADSQARAFVDDPAYNWIFKTDLLKKLRWLKPRMLAFSLPFNNIIIATKKIDGKRTIVGGVAWVPPGYESPTIDYIRQGILVFPFLWGWKAFFKLLAFAQLFESQQLKHFPNHEKIWYLAIFTVDPSSQGQGIGGHLMAPILDHADKNGVTCYLETSNPKNLPIYHHFGFEIVHHHQGFPVLGAVDCWMMIRTPK